MKAVIFRHHGGPEVLEYVTNFPEPTISEDEALVRVKACSLNHLDIWVRQGLPTVKVPLPHVSGCDVSGIIAKGNNLDPTLKEGDEVVVAPGISCGKCLFCQSDRDSLCPQYQILGEHVPGGLAEFVKVKTQNLFLKPKNLTFEEASAFPLTFLTAWRMLKTHANLGPGKSVLILAAGSGIGAAAIQIARHLGAAPIIATASSKEKLEKARGLGAHCVLMTSPGFYREVLKATNGEGIDVVFEHVGPATMKNSIRSLKKGGIIVTCGATTGAEAPIDLRYFFMRELRLEGSIMGSREEFETVLELVSQGKLKPIVDSVFPLEETRAAQEKLLSRNVFGKIIIKI